MTRGGGARAAAALGAAAFLVFFVGPFAYQLAASLRPGGGLAGGPGGGLTLENYAAVFRTRGFGRVIATSVGVAAATTAVSLLAGAAAAFAAAKLEFRGRSLLLFGSLAVSMFPPIALVSPLYVGLRALGLLDRAAGLVPPYATFALPLAVWMLTTFFRDVPDELYRAARVDGCTPVQAFRRVFLPLAAPGLAATAILVFVFSWNEFLFAVTFLVTPEKRTVPVSIALFAAEHLEPWGEIAAASVAATAPVVALALLFQRRIVAGLTAGAVKG